MHSCGQDNASRLPAVPDCPGLTFDPASDEPPAVRFSRGSGRHPALCSRKVTTTLSLLHGPPRDHADRGRAPDLAKINPLARTHLGKVVRFRRIAFEPSDVAECGRPPGRPRRLSAHVAAEPAYKLPMCARCSFGAFGKVLGQDRRDGRHGVLQFATTRDAASRLLLHGSANDAHLFPCFVQVTRPRRRPRRLKEPHRVLPLPLRLRRGVDAVAHVSAHLREATGRGHPALVSRRSLFPCPDS